MKKKGIYSSFLLSLLAGAIISLSSLFFPILSQDDPAKEANPEETTSKTEKKEELRPYEKLIEKCIDECMEKNDKNECREIKMATYDKVDKYLFCNESATYQGKEYDEYGREISNRSVSEKRCQPVIQRKTMKKLFLQFYVLKEKCPSAMGAKKIVDLVPKIEENL